MHGKLKIYYELLKKPEKFQNKTILAPSFKKQINEHVIAVFHHIYR